MRWSSVQSAAYPWPAAAGPPGLSRMATRGAITNVHLSQQCGASPQVKELPWQAGGTELVGRAPGTGWEVYRVKQGHLGEGCKRCES